MMESEFLGHRVFIKDETTLMGGEGRAYCLVTRNLETGIEPLETVEIWRPSAEGPRFVRSATALTALTIRIGDIPEHVLRLHHDEARRTYDGLILYLRGRHGKGISTRTPVTLLVFIV